MSGDSDKVKAAEKEIELIKTRWLMANHLKMDKSSYDAVNRKLSIYDIELGARDILLRLDLDIPLSKFTAPIKVNDMLSHKSLDAPHQPQLVKTPKLTLKILSSEVWSPHLHLEQRKTIGARDRYSTTSGSKKQSQS